MIYFNLRRDWFGPDGNRRRATKNPHSEEDEMLVHLPSDAQMLDKDFKPTGKTAAGTRGTPEKPADQDLRTMDKSPVPTTKVIAKAG